MAENTDEEHLNISANTQSEDPSDEITAITEKDTINLNQDIENMEVHAHELHKMPGHGWKHYLFEFVMLFLAVSLGAYVENLRESLLHKEEVKTHINSLVSDLQTDISLLESGLDRNTYSAQMADSLIEMLHSAITNTTDIYVAARSVTANLGIIIPTQNPLTK